MQCSRPLKLVSTFIQIVLLTGIIQNYAYCEATIDSNSLTRGAKAWANNCGRCHNLRSPSEFSSEQWQTIVLHMRLHAGLTGQEERDIYNFLSTQSPKPNEMVAVSTVQTAENTQLSDNNQTNGTKTETPSPEINLEVGKKIFHQTCVACHGENGKGAIPGVPDMTSSNSPLWTLSDDELAKRIEEGHQSPNSTMAMPAKGGNPSLTREQIKAVLGYMKHSFGH